MCQKCNKRCFISGAKSFCLKVMEFFVVAGVSRQQQQRMTRMTMGLFNCRVTTNHNCTVVSEVMNRDFREGGIQGDRISDGGEIDCKKDGCSDHEEAQDYA